MKKFSAIIICLLMFLTCTLTGCAGFSVNRVKYFNDVVATVGTTKITRFELLNAYNSNSSYYSQNGKSEKEAMNEVLDLLIDREALYQYALNFKPEGGLGANPYLPTRYQVNEIVSSIFDNMDSQIEEFVTTAKKVLNLEIENADAEEESSTTTYKREDYNYKKRAEIQKEVVYYVDSNYSAISTEKTPYYKTNYSIKYITEQEPEKGTYKDLIDSDFLEDYTLTRTYTEGAKDIVEEIMNKYSLHLQEKLATEEPEHAQAIEQEVYKLLCNSLINYEYYLRDENGKPYSTVMSDLLYRYFKRTFEAQIKSQYLTNFQENYLENENLSIDALVKAYQNLSTMNENKYSADFLSSYKADMKNTSTNFEQVVYHPNIDADTQFGYFLHTLFQFSDEQKTAITDLQKQYGDKTFAEYAKEYKEKLENPNLDKQTEELLTKEYDEYKLAYSNLVLNTKAVFRNAAGEETDDSNTKTLRDVLNSNEYKNLAKNQNIYEFVDFMFAHTQDTATLTADSPYVVGSYDESKGETFSTNSSMEEAFTNEAMKLMQTSNGNALSDIYSSENSNEFDVEKFCITSYGVHILYYICPLYECDIAPTNASKVYIQTDNKDYDPAGKLNLYKTFMNPLSELKNKTYFDMLFDLVYPASSNTFTSKTNYSKYEESLAEQAKTTYTVVKYTTRINATKTRI